MSRTFVVILRSEVLRQAQDGERSRTTTKNLLSESLDQAARVEILRGVYPEPMNEMLRYAQHDKRRRAQDDKIQNDIERQFVEKLNS